MSERDAAGLPAEAQAQAGLIVYRENKPFVRRALGAGKIDYLS